MIVTIPEAGGDNWFSFPIDYDGRILTCTLYWCEELQSLHDKLAKQLVTDAYNDPIINADGRYIRDYDVLEYYQADSPVVDITTFSEWSQRHELTSYLRSIPYDYALQNAVIDRSATYYGILQQMNHLKDMCVWTFTISDEGEDVTGVIRPGGYYTRAGSWDLWIRAPMRTSIDRDGLQFVTLEFI